MAPLKYVFTFRLLGTVMLASVGFAAASALWAAMLDRNEERRAFVRRALGLVLLAALLAESALCRAGVVERWAFQVCLAVDFWGGVDAVLRYPAAPDPATPFGAKQVILALLKAGSLAAGLRGGIRADFNTWVALLLLDVLWLPAAYVMAIPIDASLQAVGDEENNVDVIVRVWRLAVHSAERQRCCAMCQAWASELGRCVRGAAKRNV